MHIYPSLCSPIVCCVICLFVHEKQYGDYCVHVHSGIRTFKLCVFECMINPFTLKSSSMEKDIECIVNTDC